MHVVIVGPPHSGKSTFTAALIETVRERQRKRSFTLPFEWMTLDIIDNSLEYVLDETGETSRKTDATWTNENARTRAEKFASRSSKLVIADAPGKLTEQFDIVVEPADSAVILISNKKSDHLTKWRERIKGMNIAIDAELTSFLNADKSVELTKRSDGTLVGTVRSISRDEFQTRGTHAYDDSSRQVIRAVAKTLLTKARK